MNDSYSAAVHKFPRELAQSAGILPAIVYGYIAYKVSRSKNFRENKPWFYATIDEIHKKYPYASRSAVGDALKLLGKHGLILKRNFNKKKYDKTGWYTVTGKRPAKEALTKFYVTDAVEHDVESATLLYNLKFWITKKRKTDPTYSFHPLSPAERAEDLPMSEKTIRRKMKKLVDLGVVIGRKGTNSKVPEYAFPDEQPEKRDQPVLDETRTIANKERSESDMIGSNPDEIRTNPDNYTHYKTIDKAIENPIEQTPLPAARGVVLDVPGDSEESGHSSSGRTDATAASGGSSNRLAEKWSGVTQANQHYLDGLPPDEFESLVGEACTIARGFISQISMESFVKIPKTTPAHQLYQVINKQWDSMPQKPPNIFTNDPNLLRKFAIEATVHAIRLFYDYPEGKGVPQGDYKGYVRELTYDISKAEDKWYEQKAKNEETARQKEWQRQWQEQYNVGKHATAADIPAKEKADLLIKSVAILRKVGVFHDGYVHSASLKLFKSQHNLAEEFFTLNSALTSHEVLSLLNKCAVAALEPHEEGFDPRFYARRGVDAVFLFRNVDKVVSELNLERVYPDITPIPNKD
jgi:hypothetical protein